MSTTKKTKKDFKHGYNGYRRHACRCEVCQSEFTRLKTKYNLKNKKHKIIPVLIDGTPLAAIYREKGLLVGGQIRKMVSRWETVGIDVYTADKRCMELGMHPIQVFGETYFDGLMEEERRYCEVYGDNADV